MASEGLKKAAFAAGCFWGVEAAFRRVAGVKEAVVGYTGGTTENPTYKMVCTGKTGHAETTEVTYDPSEVSYAQLLEAFWNMHDPTQVNRQGVDVGSQYRSVIFYYDEEQRAEAERSKKEMETSGRFRRAIATQIVPATMFWRAEDYHQRYFEKNKNAQCHI
ncbi:MAG: methionine sulfoxide reductase A [Methanomassiliicoccales archaeon PtaU1.Bin124]|nr:MAG: methionine sulfoxide reductase A [Methanomassiliicoccales archaeon PtaU1.Bin124]